MSGNDKDLEHEMELEIKEKTIAELQKKIVDLESKLTSGAQQPEKIKGPVLIEKKVSNPTSNLVEDLQTSLKTKDIQIQSKDGKIKVLETDKINMKKEIQDLRQEIQEKSNKISELETKITLTSKQGKDGGMTEELIQDLEGKIKKQKKMIDQLKSELEASKKDAGKVSSAPIVDSGEKYKKIEELESQIITLKAKIDKLTVENIEKTDKIAKLQTELSTKEKEKSTETIKTPGSVNEFVEELQSRVEKLKKQNKKLTDDIESYKHLDQVKGELDKKELSIKEKDLKIEELDNKISSLVKDYESKLKNMTQEFEEKMEQSDNSIQELKKQIINLTSGEEKEKIQSLSRENNTLKIQLDTLRKENESLKITIRESNVDSIKFQMDILKKERDEVKQKLEFYIKKTEELEKDLSDANIRQQIMRIREMRSLLESLKKKNKQQLLEINDLRKRLAESTSF